MKADWNNDMKTARHIKAIRMRKWIIFYAIRDENIAYDFSVNVTKIANSMDMVIDEPLAYATIKEYFYLVN